MKKYFIFIALVLCFAMMLTIVGCGEQEVSNNNTNNTNDANNANNTNDADNTNDTDNTDKEGEVFDSGLPNFDYYENIEMSEHFTINYMSTNTNNPDIDKYSFVKDTLEEKFNVTFDFSPASGKNQDMELLSAADSIPECAWVYLGNSQKAWTMYESGLTRSIPVDFVKKYAPYLTLAMEDDKSFHPTMLVPGEDDEYYTIFAARYRFYTYGSGLAIRMDWLENLGIEPKGDLEMIEEQVYISDEAYLLDEFSDILYEFTFSDPDMNGEQDTYGLNAYGLKADDFGYSGILYSALGMHNTYTPDENGWAVPLSFSRANFEFYKQLGIWTDQKVITPGLQTTTANDWERNWGSGKYGASSYEFKQLTIDYANRTDGYWSNSMPFILFNTNPDAKLIIAPPVLNNDGSGGGGRPYANFIRSPGAGYFYVRKDVSDEKLKRILMFMDYSAFNQDGFWFLYYGYEHIHWEFNADTSVTILPQEDLAINMRVEGQDFFSTPTQPNEKLATTFVRPTVNFKHVSIIAHEHQINNWTPLSFSYIDDSPVITWGDDLEWFDKSNLRARNTAYKDARAELLGGNSDIDTVWDNLMNTFNNMGYQEYLLALNQNSFLRDELFNEGIEITPAEKFPRE